MSGLDHPGDCRAVVLLEREGSCMPGPQPVHLSLDLCVVAGVGVGVQGKHCSLNQGPVEEDDPRVWTGVRVLTGSWGRLPMHTLSSSSQGPVTFEGRGCVLSQEEWRAHW